MGATFFVLVFGHCIQALVLCHSSVVVLNHFPVGHMQHMEFILLHALFTLIQHQLCVCCHVNVDVLASHLEVLILSCANSLVCFSCLTAGGMTS